jgi:Papain family cysteine protease
LTGGPTPAALVDLRPSLPAVRDQGQRGTCVAFAVTAAHEVARSAPAVPDDLSEEALYWGCKRTDGNWHAGTTFDSASIAIGRWGQPLETVWPYDGYRADGVAYSPPGRAGGKGWFKSGLDRVATDLPDVRSLLNAGRPVALGLTVFDTLLRPDPTGRIQEPAAGSAPRGRHAVLAVGHQATELLIRNSWGASWALNGYAWIADGYLERHLHDAWVIDASATATTSGTAPPASQGDTYGAP